MVVPAWRCVVVRALVVVCCRACVRARACVVARLVVRARVVSVCVCVCSRVVARACSRAVCSRVGGRPHTHARPTHNSRRNRAILCPASDRRGPPRPQLRPHTEGARGRARRRARLAAPPRLEKKRFRHHHLPSSDGMGALNGLGWMGWMGCDRWDGWMGWMDGMDWMGWM